MGSIRQSKGNDVEPVEQLKKVLRGLMLLRTQGRQVASDVLWLWGVKNKDVSFFQGFPGFLERFESVLKILGLPSERRDTFQDWLIASGELLLHLYVKEITGKLFSEESSVLLEASAVSCGLGHGREYRQAVKLNLPSLETDHLRLADRRQPEGWQQTGSPDWYREVF